MAPATAAVVRRRTGPRVGASRTTAQRRWVGRAPPNLVRVIRLDAATVLLQWATGGLLFSWVTTRHREVGLGYGWLLRGVYLVMAAGALACGLAFGVVPGAGGGRRPAWCWPPCVALVVSLAAAGRGGVRAAGRARPPHGPGRGHDRHRPLTSAAVAGRRRPATASRPPRRGSSRPGSTWWLRSSAPSGWSPRAGTPAGARGWPWPGCWPAPPSSASSPTPCSSATGTSCSPACPGGC